MSMNQLNQHYFFEAAPALSGGRSGTVLRAFSETVSSLPR